MPETTETHPGRKALRHVARILEQRPRKDDHELSRLTRCLADFRAELIAARSGGGATAADRRRLAHLNAVISIVMGMHFPIGPPPWEELGKAETWLRNLVEGVET